MQIYVAAPYAARDRLRELFIHWRQFEPDNGWLGVTSGWLDATHDIHPGTLDATPDNSDEQVRAHVEGDFHDILIADALLLFTGQDILSRRWVTDISQTTSGGRHVETGYALAHSMPVVVIGQPENVFHRGACIVVPDFLTALDKLKEF